jgi:hypothetical protein
MVNKGFVSNELCLAKCIYNSISPTRLLQRFPYYTVKLRPCYREILS